MRGIYRSMASHIGGEFHTTCRPPIVQVVSSDGWSCTCAMTVPRIILEDIIKVN